MKLHNARKMLRAFLVAVSLARVTSAAAAAANGKVLLEAAVAAAV